jgi:hypothetical protein
MHRHVWGVTRQVAHQVAAKARMTTNCHTGAVSELLFCAQAGMRGWSVFTPVGHAHTVDVCLVKPGGRPIGVQVKTAAIARRYPHAAADYHIQSGCGRSGKTPYGTGAFDVLAAWLPDIEEFAFWTLADIACRKTIRYSPKRHRAPGNWDLLDTAAHTC